MHARTRDALENEGYAQAGWTHLGKRNTLEEEAWIPQSKSKTMGVGVKPILTFTTNSYWRSGRRDRFGGLWIVNLLDTSTASTQHANLSSKCEHNMANQLDRPYLNSWKERVRTKP